MDALLHDRTWHLFLRDFIDGNHGMDIEGAFLEPFQVEAGHKPPAPVSVGVGGKRLVSQRLGDRITDAGDEDTPFLQRTEQAKALEIDSRIQKAVSMAGQQRTKGHGTRSERGVIMGLAGREGTPTQRNQTRPALGTNSVGEFRVEQRKRRPQFGLRGTASTCWMWVVQSPLMLPETPAVSRVDT